MAAFSFEAFDRDGARSSGMLNADSQSAASGELRSRGLIVLSLNALGAQVAGPSDSAQKSAGFSLSPSSWLPPARVDVELGLQQIASMLRAGMTLLAALRTAAEHARRHSMRRVWEQVADRIQAGGSLAEALQRHPRCFPEFVVQLVHVGEASGALDTVLTRAAEQLERSRALKLTMLNALMYPFIVTVLAVGVAAYMMISLMPKLQKFLAGRHRKLPPITQMLMDVSAWFQHYAGMVGIGLVLVIVGLVAIRRWPPGRMALDIFSLRVPVIGTALRTAATASFARTMSILLDSGVTLVRSLEILEHLLENVAYRRVIGAARETVMNGGSLSGSLATGKLFMPMLSRVTAVGEATGSLDTVLAETASFHEKQLAATVRWLSIVIEPAILLVVGGIVGFVYISFFVALYSVAG
ncbi:MAG: type II secretion system F family protein [Planctomycetota bacterium]